MYYIYISEKQAAEMFFFKKVFNNSSRSVWKAVLGNFRHCVPRGFIWCLRHLGFMAVLRTASLSPRGVQNFFALNAEVKRTLIDGYKIIPPESVYKTYTDMKTKYVQKVIPRVSTERYNQLKPAEVRKVLLKTFNTHLQGKVVYNKHIGIPIQFVSGRKTVYGEALYRKKLSVIDVLGILMEHAKYNNFGQRKANDPKNLIGYYNFKAYVYIDDKKECVRLAVRAMANGTFYYNVEVNKKK